MRILNFGSLNLDYVYSVQHIVAKGETISSTDLQVFCGGKGLNQSISLARAGANVCHAGMIGADGDALKQACLDNGVDTKHVRVVEERSGNAIIQVSDSGENSIILFGGANQQNSHEFIKLVLADFGKDDWILLQNEVNLLSEIIEQAHEKGIRIAINPSPYNDILNGCNLSKVSLFLINEVEGVQITGCTEPDDILAAMQQKFPSASVVLTLGKRGVVYMSGDSMYRHGVYDVKVVDTTAAGDTFTGYFLASISSGKSAEESLRLASIASSIAVSRKGAVASIPTMAEVESSTIKLASTV